MRNPVGRILLVSAVIALAACLAATPRAAAADRTFTLFGDANLPGWGLSNSTITTPGPTLTVDLGDNVTLMLTGMDTTNLRWYIDYDGDSIRDANEPRSPAFDDNPAPTQWNFTADTVGTFTYRDQIDPAMNGTIVIQNTTGLPGGTFRLDNSLILVVGLTVGFIAVLLIGSAVMRRKKERQPEHKEE